MDFRLPLATLLFTSPFFAGCNLPAQSETGEVNQPKLTNLRDPAARRSVAFFGSTPRPQQAEQQKPEIQLTEASVPVGKVPTSTGQTLDQVIGQCLQADPRLSSGFEPVNQARANSVTASLLPNPELFADVQLLPLTRPFTILQQGGPPQMDVALSYPIDWFVFGKRAAAMQSAKAGAEISETEYSNLVRQRVTQAAVAFFDVAEAQALLSLAARDLQSVKEIQQLIVTRNRAAKLATVDRNRLHLSLLRHRQAVNDARSALQAAQARLRPLLGTGRANDAMKVYWPLDREVKLDPPSLEDALVLAENNRPDIESLRQQVEKAAVDVTVEKRNAYPPMKVQAGYTRQFQRNIGFPDASSWMVALTASLPVFDRNQGNRLKASSLLTQRRAELSAGLVELRAEVEQALIDLCSARKNAQAQDQAQLAEEIFSAVRNGWKAGDAVTDLLDAQRDHSDSRRFQLTAHFNYWRALHRFFSVVGAQTFKTGR